MRAWTNATWQADAVAGASTPLPRSTMRRDGLVLVVLVALFAALVLIAPLVLSA